MEERWPGCLVVGAESPPFRSLTGGEEVEMIERVHATNAHVVWVGLGTPSQDVFVDRFRSGLNRTLVAVGAAFDFHSGTKAQAPRSIQRAGMEWAWRLAHEPRRLWRRYLVGNARFVAAVIMSRPRLCGQQRP